MNFKTSTIFQRKKKKHLKKITTDLSILSCEWYSDEEPKFPVNCSGLAHGQSSQADTL